MLSHAATEGVEPPSSLGGYLLEMPLARGGMGSVYLATGLGPGGVPRRYALKCIHPHIAADTYLRAMFIDEARLLAQLAHPGLCRVVDYGEEGEIAYIVMEYLEGLPLDVFTDGPERVRMMRREPRYFRMVARVMANLLEGLHAAHELRSFNGKPLEVVHRDISPHNLFLCFDGTQRVLDFGIASAAEQLRLTEVGSVKGKFPYMAPEQARGLMLDRRADIWAMGVVLWELLAGRRAFGPNMSRRQVMKSMLGGLPPAQTHDSRVPECLDAIALRAVTVDLDGRYPTAREMARELEFWLGNCGDSVPAADVGEWVRRTQRVLHEGMGDARTVATNSTQDTRPRGAGVPRQAATSTPRRPPAPAAMPSISIPSPTAAPGSNQTAAAKRTPSPSRRAPRLQLSAADRDSGVPGARSSVPAREVSPSRPSRWTGSRSASLSALAVAAAALCGIGVLMVTGTGQPVVHAMLRESAPAAVRSAAHASPAAQPAPAPAAKPPMQLSVEPLVPAADPEAPSSEANLEEAGGPPTKALAEGPGHHAATEPERRPRRPAARSVQRPWPAHRAQRRESPPHEEPAPVSTGRVYLQASGASGSALVYRHGVLAGHTPLELTLPAGTHRLELAAGPDQPRTPVQVQVLPGTRVRVNAALSR